MWRHCQLGIQLGGRLDVASGSNFSATFVAHSSHFTVSLSGAISPFFWISAFLRA
jgi:hypothetical protein